MNMSESERVSTTYTGGEKFVCCLYEMSHIWTFSPSTKEVVDRCISAARPPDETNKWIQKFGLKNYIQNDITSMDVNDDTSTINIVQMVEDPCPNNRNEDLNVEYYQEIIESIEEDPISKFELFIEECLKDHKLLVYLANKLSYGCIEKITNHIFEHDHLDKVFVEIFHKVFIPYLLKKEHNCLTQDILIKSHRVHPVHFITLLEIIIKDIDITNKVLEDLIQNFNGTELSEVITVITDLELSTEQFLHNKFTIYTAYKGCKKTVEIQNSILTYILHYAKSCVTDKNYGRLLLAFLQTEKELSTIKDYKSIEKTVETHRSPFKRPCMNLLQELLEKHNDTMDTTTLNSDVI